MAITITVGSDVGDDYAVLKDALDYVLGTANADDVIVELRGETHVLNQNTSFHPHVSNTSLTMRPMTGSGHEGGLAASSPATIQWSANAKLQQTLGSNAVPCTIQDIVFDFNAKRPPSTGDGMISFDALGGRVNTIERCIFKNLSSIQNGQWAVRTGGNVTLNFNSCLFYYHRNTGTSSGRSGFLRVFSGDSNDVNLNHCTFHDIDSGGSGNASCVSQGGSGDMVIANCIGSEVAAGTGTATVFHDDATGTFTVTDSLSSDATGSAGLQNEAGTTTFTDPDNASLTARDYSLKAGSAAIGAGTALGTGTHAKSLASAWYLSDDRATSGSVDLGCYVAAAAPDFSDTFTGTADTPIYDRDPDVGPRWLRS